MLRHVLLIIAALAWSLIVWGFVFLGIRPSGHGLNISLFMLALYTVGWLLWAKTTWKWGREATTAASVTSSVLNSLNSGKDVHHTAEIITNTVKRANKCVASDHLDRVLERYRESGSVDRAADYAEYLTSITRDHVHASFVLQRFLAWVIPTIGFGGTVLGMRDGMNELSQQLGGAAGVNAVVISISKFAVAFDATLTGIIASATLIFGLALSERLIERLLIGLDRLLVNEILPKLTMSADSQTQRMQNALSGSLESHQEILVKIGATFSQIGPILSRSLDPMASQLAETTRRLGDVSTGGYGVSGIDAERFADAITILERIDTSLRDIAQRVPKGGDSEQKSLISCVEGMTVSLRELVITLGAILQVINRIDTATTGQLSPKQLEQISTLVREIKESSSAELATLFGIRDIDGDSHGVLQILASHTEDLKQAVNSSNDAFREVGRAMVQDVKVERERLMGELTETVNRLARIVELFINEQHEAKKKELLR